MENTKQIKIQLSIEEADAIARAVKQQPGESLTAALKKYFRNRGQIEAQTNDQLSNADVQL